ncbi:MAG TPA: hypothetical protein PKE12_15305 [Kiritimatiellia bacterium]|nr:hypothetical protein [Kiritimatiellia bacterium]
MKATTIKLDGDLLADVERAKPREMSVTSYVKDTLRRRITADLLREASEKYNSLLERNPRERAFMEEWERADLLSEPPKPKVRR